MHYCDCDCACDCACDWLVIGAVVQIVRLEEASTDMEFVCRSERDAAHVSVQMSVRT